MLTKYVVGFYNIAKIIHIKSNKYLGPPTSQGYVSSFWKTYVQIYNDGNQMYVMHI